MAIVAFVAALASIGGRRWVRHTAPLPLPISFGFSMIRFMCFISFFLFFFALLHFVLVSWFSSYFPCLQNYLCILHFVSFFYVERLLVAICLRRKLFANKSNKLNNLTQRKLLKWAKIRAVVEVEEAVVEAVLVVAAAAAM